MRQLQVYLPFQSSVINHRLPIIPPALLISPDADIEGALLLRRREVDNGYQTYFNGFFCD
jgi:hypothetical protein